MLEKVLTEEQKIYLKECKMYEDAIECERLIVEEAESPYDVIDTSVKYSDKFTEPMNSLLEDAEDIDDIIALTYYTNAFKAIDFTLHYLLSVAVKMSTIMSLKRAYSVKFYKNTITFIEKIDGIDFNVRKFDGLDKKELAELKEKAKKMDPPSLYTYYIQKGNK